MLGTGVQNTTDPFVRTFILLRLSDVFSLQIIFLLMFSVMYLMILSGNLLIIIVVRLNARLQTPMYFFLSNLSVIDICFSSTVVPKILVNTISKDHSISFVGCATQMYFHLALGGVECLLLAVMAYDRYTAICKPLQYNLIMDKKLCTGLVVGCWIVSFTNSLILTTFTFQLPYCKSNLISHFFCEMPPLLRLSCRDIWFNELAEYISGAIVALGSFTLILVSYLWITLTVLKFHTTKDKLKAFSTCASHIAVVTLYYGTIMFMHLHPRSSSSAEQDRVVTILYTVVTPMLNPIIYSIRNKDIKEAIKKTLCFVV
ncbi:PREDICTED: olfactory receptor 1020-like [Nanorana parkeri]|uniref:olfactory receptor 1020-like n=1 Tax=Nanorana parkeri TaxID=125878 RepID=UPI0008548DC9|nr:PREDICTED: olfactory receptor 1020-like [Nanorana parkeri]